MTDTPEQIAGVIGRYYARRDFEKHGICSPDVPECADMEYCGDCGKRTTTNPDNDLCRACESELAPAPPLTGFAKFSLAVRAALQGEK